jgi:N-methylhydantoinase A
MEEEGARTLFKGGSAEHIKFERSVYARFIGQGSETNIPIPERNFSQVKRKEVRRRFDKVYERLYGRTYPDSPVEFINFKVRASLPERLLRLPKLENKGGSLGDAVKGQRQAYSGIARDFIPFSVYDRYKLFPGVKLQGPAIIEERESTVIVGEDASVSVDDFGFLWIDVKRE